MHLSREEAIAILTTWKETGTRLRVFFSQPGSDRMFEATVGEVTAVAVQLVSASESLGIELVGAQFNGDPDASPSSEYTAYLICEFRSGERCYFYVPQKNLRQHHEE